MNVPFFAITNRIDRGFRPNGVLQNVGFGQAMIGVYRKSRRDENQSAASGHGNDPSDDVVQCAQGEIGLVVAKRQNLANRGADLGHQR
jgi:hypothetical protein